jgi:hypothetical protein
VHGSRRGSRTIEHVGSAHDELELEALKDAARQRLAGGQGELDLGLDGSISAAAGPSVAPSARSLEIASSRRGIFGTEPSRAEWTNIPSPLDRSQAYADKHKDQFKPENLVDKFHPATSVGTSTCLSGRTASSPTASPSSGRFSSASV